MWPLVASGKRRNMPSSIPTPARKIGTNTTARAKLCPVHFLSGVSISTGTVPHPRAASPSNKIDDSCIFLRNSSGAVVLARKNRQFRRDQRVLNDCYAVKFGFHSGRHLSSTHCIRGRFV